MCLSVRVSIATDKYFKVEHKLCFTWAGPRLNPVSMKAANVS